MASKKPTHSDVDAVSKQRSPRPTVGNFDVPVRQQIDPVLVIRRARLDPDSLTPRDVLQLQRTVGNRAAQQLLEETQSQYAAPLQENSPPVVMTGQPPFASNRSNRIIQRLMSWEDFKAATEHKWNRRNKIKKVDDALKAYEKVPATEDRIVDKKNLLVALGKGMCEVSGRKTRLDSDAGGETNDCSNYPRAEGDFSAGRGQNNR